MKGNTGDGDTDRGDRQTWKVTVAMRREGGVGLGTGRREDGREAPGTALFP